MDKRFFDVIVSLTVIVIGFPLILSITLLVYVNMGAPVLFVQERVGRKGKVFKMYKFRTMTDERDETGELLPDSERLTKFGKFLRSTSFA